MEDHKVLLGIIAIILTFVGFIPYIHSILKGVTKPHVFSWVIWGITTVIVFFAQYADEGGAGTWCTGISGVTTIFIAALAYTKKADITITKSDWFFFIISLLTVPFWYITANPLWAVVILTTVDTIAFIPTFRKGYVKPFEEQLLLYYVMAIRNFVAVAALEHYSLTTLLFPVVIAITCVIFIVVITFRRKSVLA
jgi:hypothetical protein